MQADCHLAIGDFAQSPTILSGHSHGSFASLGKGSFVNHPHFRLGQQIHHLLCQPLLDLLHGPWTLTDKLTQRLHVGSGDPLGQGLNGLATTLHKQPLKINLGPTVAFTAAERRGQIGQKPVQPTIQCGNFFGCHGPNLTNPENLSIYLTEY